MLVMRAGILVGVPARTCIGNRPSPSATTARAIRPPRLTALPPLLSPIGGDVAVHHHRRRLRAAPLGVPAVAPCHYEPIPAGTTSRPFHTVCRVCETAVGDGCAR